MEGKERRRIKKIGKKAKREKRRQEKERKKMEEESQETDSSENDGDDTGSSDDTGDVVIGIDVNEDPERGNDAGSGEMADGDENDTDNENKEKEEDETGDEQSNANRAWREKIMKVRTKYRKSDYENGKMPMEVMMKVVKKPKLRAGLQSRLSQALANKETRVRTRSPAYHALKGRADGLKKFIEEDEKDESMKNYLSAEEVNEKSFRKSQKVFIQNQGGKIKHRLKDLVKWWQILAHFTALEYRKVYATLCEGCGTDTGCHYTTCEQWPNQSMQRMKDRHGTIEDVKRHFMEVLNELARMLDDIGMAEEHLVREDEEENLARIEKKHRGRKE